MTIDLFGRKARADLARLEKQYNEATHQLAAQDGCREALTAVIHDGRDALNKAHVRIAGGGHQHRLIRDVLTEELAVAVVDSLAAKWAMDLADRLAVKTGLDVRAGMRSRINEMSGVHEMPARPHLADGPDAREHPDTGEGEAEAAPDSDDTSGTETSDAPVEEPAEVEVTG